MNSPPNLLVYPVTSQCRCLKASTQTTKSRNPRTSTHGMCSSSSPSPSSPRRATSCCSTGAPRTPRGPRAPARERRNNRPPALYRLRVKTHTASPYGLFYWAFPKIKKPIRGLFSPVWVFSMSRYRAGGLFRPRCRSVVCWAVISDEGKEIASTTTLYYVNMVQRFKMKHWTTSSPKPASTIYILYLKPETHP